MDIPLFELKHGYEAFEKHEWRDAMYRVAARLVDHLWPSMEEVANVSCAAVMGKETTSSGDLRRAD